MRYHYVIDRPGSECDPNAVNIGPTLTESWMFPPPPVRINRNGIADQTTLKSRREDGMIKRWRNQDLATFYRQQRSNRYR